MLSAVSFGGRFAAAGRNADEFPADNPGATDFGNAVFGQFHVFADRHAHHGTNSITSNRPFALVLFNKLPDVPQGVLSLRDHSVKRCLRGFAHLDEIRGFTNNHRRNICVSRRRSDIITLLLPRKILREAVDVFAPLSGEGIAQRANVPAGRPIETARHVKYRTAFGIVAATIDSNLFGIAARE